jgi:RNA polymerase sigma-70 factor (ECF subfamily)
MNRQEFDIFSERIRAKLLAVARSLNRSGRTDDGEDEDIVQETLAALWNLSESGYPVRDAEALAVKITKTTCVEHFRRRRSRPQPLRGEAYEGGAPATAATDLSDCAEIRRRMFAGLTETERLCLNLRNTEGLSLDEIAAATGKPKDSVKTTISSARRKMLEQLKKEL